eukprot:scaffold293656_cov28-Tisochrysis_lutea.AAC.1
MTAAPRSSDSARRNCSSAARAATSRALVASSSTMRGRAGNSAKKSCTRRRCPLEQAARVLDASRGPLMPSTPRSSCARSRACCSPSGPASSTWRATCEAMSSAGESVQSDSSHSSVMRRVDPAARRLPAAGNEAEERALASTVCANQQQPASVRQGEVDAAHDGRGGILVCEVGVAQLDRRARRRHGARRERRVGTTGQGRLGRGGGNLGGLKELRKQRQCSVVEGFARFCCRLQDEEWGWVPRPSNKKLEDFLEF